jgi:mono/diheme cytochrome c family protein
MPLRAENSVKEGIMMRGTISMVSALLLMLFGSWAVAETRPPNPKQGETLYQQHCLRCHGKAGDGLGPDARDLIVPPANLQSLKSRSKTDMELLLSISHGVLFSPMHGWRDRLSEQDMLDVLSYIRSLAPFLPVT